MIYRKSRRSYVFGRTSCRAGIDYIMIDDQHYPHKWTQVSLTDEDPASAEIINSTLFNFNCKNPGRWDAARDISPAEFYEALQQALEAILENTMSTQAKHEHAITI